MKIPIGNFGFQTAGTQQGAASNPGATAVGSSLKNSGNAMMGVGEDMQRREEEEEKERQRVAKENKQRQDAMEKANAADALLDYEIYAQETAADIEQQVQTGTLDYNEASQQYDSLMAKAPQYQSSDQLIMQGYQRGTKRAAFKGQSSVTRASQKAMSADYRSRFDSGLDKLGKMAGMPGADVEEVNGRADSLRIIGEQSGMPQNQIDKKLQDFKDSNWFNQASQMQNEYSDSIDGLTRLKHQLVSHDGFYAEKLDPEKRTALIKSIDGRIDQLNNRAERAADKREAQAERALGEMDKQVASGVPGTAQQWLAWSEQVKGTAFEGEFKDRLDDEREVQGLLRKPLAEQTAYIQQKRQQMATQGANLRTQANLNRLDAAVEANTKMLRETPLVFNQNTTGQETQPISITSLATPDGRNLIGTQLRDRFNTVTALQKKYGPQVALNPWLPQESDAIKQMLATGSNEVQLGILSTIAQASPNGQSYTAALKAVAADQPALMLAGMAQYRQLTTETGRSVADTILRGNKILTAKSATMPTEEKFLSDFDGQVGNAFPFGSQERAQAFLAYKSIYAALSEDWGVSHKDDKSLINRGAANTAKWAAQIATGGIFDYNGRKVIPPYGMKEDKFLSNVGIQIEGIVKNTGYRQNDLDDMPLASVPGKEGLYYLLFSDQYLRDKEGNPVMVNAK